VHHHFILRRNQLTKAGRSSEGSSSLRLRSGRNAVKWKFDFPYQRPIQYSEKQDAPMPSVAPLLYFAGLFASSKL
jgi:hypothetical protein